LVKSDLGSFRHSICYQPKLDFDASNSQPDPHRPIHLECRYFPPHDTSRTISITGQGFQRFVHKTEIRPLTLVESISGSTIVISLAEKATYTTETLVRTVFSCKHNGEKHLMSVRESGLF
jgi:hypothetical protein